MNTILEPIVKNVSKAKLNLSRKRVFVVNNLYCNFENLSLRYTKCMNYYSIIYHMKKRNFNQDQMNNAFYSSDDTSFLS